MSGREKKGHMLVMGFDLSIIKFLHKVKAARRGVCVIRNILSMCAINQSYMRPFLDALYRERYWLS